MKIFINSVPKAGTNLVSRAFDLSGIKYGNLGLSSSTLVGDRYLLRQFVRRSFFERDPVILGLDVQSPIRRSWLSTKLRNIDDGAYITGHANWSPGLHHLLCAYDFVTIMVIRHPLDVLVSYAHYVGSSRKHYLNEVYRTLDFDSRVRLTLDGGRVCGLDVAPFEIILARSDEWLEQDKVAVLRYEDVVGEKGGGSNLQRDLAFEDLNKKYKLNLDLSAISTNLYGSSHTFRSGKTRSFNTELSSKLTNLCFDRLGKLIDKWGY